MEDEGRKERVRKREREERAHKYKRSKLINKRRIMAELENDYLQWSRSIASVS